jgi:hypothetical protein
MRVIAWFSFSFAALCALTCVTATHPTDQTVYAVFCAGNILAAGLCFDVARR